MQTPLVAALLSFTFLQQAPAPAPAPPQTSYHDDGLRFTYTFPAGFTTAGPGSIITDRARKQAPENVQGALNCLTTPVYASHQPSPHQVELLLAFSLDFGCMGKQVTADVLTPIATNALQQGLSKVGSPALLKPVAYNLDGHDSLFLQGSAPDAKDGIPGYAGVACTLLTNTVFCWTVLTAYPSHLAAIFASPVQFGDRTATPIVPASAIITPAAKDPAPDSAHPSR